MRGWVVPPIKTRWGYYPTSSHHLHLTVPRPGQSWAIDKVCLVWFADMTCWHEYSSAQLMGIRKNFIFKVDFFLLCHSPQPIPPTRKTKKHHMTQLVRWRLAGFQFKLNLQVGHECGKNDPKKDNFPLKRLYSYGLCCMAESLLAQTISNLKTQFLHCKTLDQAENISTMTGCSFLLHLDKLFEQPRILSQTELFWSLD